VIFIETPIFTNDVKAMLPDDDYRQLQQVLADRADAGDLIPSTGGLRKYRWSLPGRCLVAVSGPVPASFTSGA
jgi:hypothetical protein